MPIGRDAAAKAAYLAADRKERGAMVYFSACDENASIGLARGYNAQDMYWLAHVRTTPCTTRTDRLRRKADFYMILARIASRDERANVWRNL